jgi:dTDP-3-amino-3,4,6-trideoxy-alpha-D-glucopyranose N,N-dimethyltransferase
LRKKSLAYSESPRAIRASLPPYDGRVFRKSQRFYDAIYSFKDYPSEVETLRGIIRARHPEARSLLDVACGTGKHLELLRGDFDVAGVDLDPEMVRLARERLGDEVALQVGDMADFDLGRTFDVVVCLFSSIAYAKTEERLNLVLRNLVRHTAPDGLVIVEPWFYPEAWQAGHVAANFVDQDDLKIARMSVSPRLTDPLTMTFHYMVATPVGVESFTEEHVVGMFTHRQHVAAFEAAGLEVEHDPKGLMDRGLFIGGRP